MLTFGMTTGSWWLHRAFLEREHSDLDWQVALPRGLQRNETYMHTVAYMRILFQIIERSAYLDHATKCLRTLEIVTGIFKQCTGDVASQPELRVWISLKRFINAIDTIASFLNLEMLSLEKGNTWTRQSTFEQLYGCRYTQQNGEWYAINPWSIKMSVNIQSKTKRAFVYLNRDKRSVSRPVSKASLSRRANTSFLVPFLCT